MQQEDATGIICRRWEYCHHPELCQEKCHDEDLDDGLIRTDNGLYVKRGENDEEIYNLHNFVGFDFNED